MMVGGEGGNYLRKVENECNSTKTRICGANDGMCSEIHNGKLVEVHKMFEKQFG